MLFSRVCSSFLSNKSTESFEFTAAHTGGGEQIFRLNDSKKRPSRTHVDLERLPLIRPRPSNAQNPCLSAAIDNGLPVKVSKTASIALSESCRLAMVLVTALTSPPRASCIAGCPSGPFGHPLNLFFRRLSCHATTARGRSTIRSRRVVYHRLERKQGRAIV